jgi:hypothetical protein
MPQGLERMMTTEEVQSRRERRWIVLTEDGRHFALGRYTDPSLEEIATAEAGLSAQGLSGWLAVMEGSYYERANLLLMMVRPLCKPDRTFFEAEGAFLAARNTILEGLV